MKKSTIAIWVLAGVIGVAVAGCKGTPKPVAWNLHLVKKTPAVIEVDLIGVTPLEKSSWESYSMDSYWRDPEDSRRKNADKLTKALDLNEPWIIPRDDPKWQSWLKRGATELLVVADLPVRSESGTADPRRRFFPLDKKAWDADKKTLDFEIWDTLVRSMTPEKPR